MTMREKKLLPSPPPTGTERWIRRIVNEDGNVQRVHIKDGSLLPTRCSSPQSEQCLTVGGKRAASILLCCACQGFEPRLRSKKASHFFGQDTKNAENCKPRHRLVVFVSGIRTWVVSSQWIPSFQSDFSKVGLSA